MEAVKTPSGKEIVQRVADIMPVLRANARWGEQNRRLADEVVDAMIDAGVVRLLVPSQYGGYEADARTVRVGGGCTWAEVDAATIDLGYSRSRNDLPADRRGR